MRIVAALGGNALTSGEASDEPVAPAIIELAARSLAPLASQAELVITHGNGPQVGLLALQAARLGGESQPPLDVLGAESEGWIGYLLEQALDDALPGREVATLLTRVEVDPHDPAFDHPSKPVGAFYSEAEAARLGVEHGWSFAVNPRGWRRVVPSPAPRRIMELPAIRLLMEAGVVVVCAGGGGIPVVSGPAGAREGVEAVIDKDACSALLAEKLAADVLLLLTDVDGVYRDWPAKGEEPMGAVEIEALEALEFEPGSMAPKVDAACRFARRTGGLAVIGALGDATRLAQEAAGTRVRGGAA